MLTKVKKIVVHADSLVRDGICVYKSERFNIAKPVEVEIVGSDVVDLGGPRKQFFCHILDALAKNEFLNLFEGDYDTGLLPAINHDAILSGQFKMLGRIILHSILMEGPGFPVFPLPIYYYLVHRAVESAIPYLDVKYLPPRVRIIADQVGELSIPVTITYPLYAN